MTPATSPFLRRARLCVISRVIAAGVERDDDDDDVESEERESRSLKEKEARVILS